VKLVDILLLSLAFAFMIIGMHQSVTVGFAGSYWIFMLTIALFLLYNMRKNKQKAAEPSTATTVSKQAKKTVKRNGKSR
jgi:amino acid permease